MYTQTTLQYACEIVPGYGLSRLLLDHEQDSGTIDHVNKACFLSHILVRTFWLVTSVVSKQCSDWQALTRSMPLTKLVVTIWLPKPRKMVETPPTAITCA